MGHYFIYKYVNGDETVYIGRSKRSVKSRVYGHSKEEKFQPYLDSKIYYFECDSFEEMVIWELSLIAKYTPILNTMSKPTSSFDLLNRDEPEWVQFNNKQKKDEKQTPITYSLRDLIDKCPNNYDLIIQQLDNLFNNGLLFSDEKIAYDNSSNVIPKNSGSIVQKRQLIEYKDKYIAKRLGMKFNNLKVALFVADIVEGWSTTKDRCNFLDTFVNKIDELYYVVDCVHWLDWD